MLALWLLPSEQCMVHVAGVVIVKSSRIAGSDMSSRSSSGGGNHQRWRHDSV